MPVVYLHGMPGAPSELELAELALAELEPTPSQLRSWFAPNRHDLSDLSQLTAAISAHYPIGDIRLVGFSLGGFIALQLAAAMRDRIAAIDLVAAPAPIEDANWQGDVAGLPLFQMARSHPRRFALTVAAQRNLAMLAPDMLRRILFASTRASDRDLSHNPAFRHRMNTLIATTMAGGAATYRAEITAYAQWEGTGLADINVPVTLWQGMADNWTAPAMANALAARIGNNAAIIRLPGLSHYGALIHALPRIAEGHIATKSRA